MMALFKTSPFLAFQYLKKIAKKNKHYRILFMKSINALLLSASLFVVIPAYQAISDEVTVSGDASSAPIYVLNGSGTTTMVVNADNIEDDPEDEFSGISINQVFTFSMDSVASGNVDVQGTMNITGDDGGGEWNASFVANTVYKIKQYGDLISYQFKHTLQSASGPQTIVGVESDSAEITSRGKAALVSEDGSFSGTMSGHIKVDGFDSWDYDVPFTQEFSDIEAADLGDWEAVLSYAVDGKKIVPAAEPSTVAVGPAEDPVDTVDLALKGTYNKKKDLFSWAAKGIGADKKVIIKVVAAGSEDSDEINLVDDKSQISAAAQKRKF